MFTHALKQLPLTDVLADSLFTNISADHFEGDESFCATLRALLFRRLQADESVRAKLEVSGIDDKELNTRHIVGFTNGLLSFNLPLPKDFMYIRVIKGFPADDFETALNNLKYVLSAFTFLPDVSLYISQAGCKSYVYVNEDKKQTVIFMLNLNQKSWHKMQSSITRLMPWYFTAALDDFETKLVHSLTQKDSSAYLELIRDFASSFNFREDRLRRLLNGFGMNYERQRYKSLLEEREKNAEHFQRLQDEISMRIVRERELISDIAGLELVLQQGSGSEITDYFICNKSLNLVDVSDDRIAYVVTTYLEYFDQNVFEKCFENTSSYFYGNSTGLAQDMQGYKKLLSAIYGDDACIRVRTCAAFILSPAGTLTPVRSSIFLKDYDNWLPNPHIDGASCMGTNATYVNRLMKDRKYIEAIEQSIASVKNINFADSAIAPKLISSLRTSPKKFLELPSGEIVSPKEALTWLCREERN